MKHVDIYPQRNRSKGPDVAIWGMTNPRAAVNLKRIAEGCVRAGLRTAILWKPYQGRGARTPADYPVKNVEFIEVAIRYDYKIVRYANPAILPLLQRDIDRELNCINPGCVITQLDHDGTDRVWQHLARKKGIPGIVIQEGMANIPKVSMEGWSLSDRRKWMWGKRTPLKKIIAAIPHPLLESCAPYMFAQYVCVWGEAMRSHLVRMGRDEKSIYVTGSPAFDNIHNRLPLRTNRMDSVMYVQQRMNMPLEERIPLYSQVINTVINELGYKLIFKLHPNSFSEFKTVKELAVKHKIPDGYLEVLDHGDAVELLDRVDAVLLATSTTAYHAAVAGVPIVILDYYSNSIRFGIGNTGGGAVVSKPKELPELLRKVMTNADYRQQLYDEAGRLIEEHLLALDGRSVKRVVEVIRRLLISH